MQCLHFLRIVYFDWYPTLFIPLRMYTLYGFRKNVQVKNYEKNIYQHLTMKIHSKNIHTDEKESNYHDSCIKKNKTEFESNSSINKIFTIYHLS